MAVLIIAADVGAKAFYLLMIWLASAIAASELSKRKGYGEKWGLGTGLLLSVVGLHHLDPRAGAGGVALAPEAGAQGGRGRGGRPGRRAQVEGPRRVNEDPEPVGGTGSGSRVGVSMRARDAWSVSEARLLTDFPRLGLLCCAALSVGEAPRSFRGGWQASRGG